MTYFQVYGSWVLLINRNVVIAQCPLVYVCDEKIKEDYEQLKLAQQTCQ